MKDLQKGFQSSIIFTLLLLVCHAYLHLNFNSLDISVGIKMISLSLIISIIFDYFVTKHYKQIINNTFNFSIILTSLFEILFLITITSNPIFLLTTFFFMNIINTIIIHYYYNKLIIKYPKLS